MSDTTANGAVLPRLVIFGAGGLGREVLVLARQINEVSPTWELVGFFDDKEHATSQIHEIGRAHV